MTQLEAYTLGYAYRLLEDALHLKKELPADKPLQGLLHVQQMYLTSGNKIDDRIVSFLYAMHRRFHFDGQHNENAMLDKQLQWVWLMGYCMLDTNDYIGQLKDLFKT